MVFWGRRALALAVAGAGSVSCSLNDPPGGKGRLSVATGGAGGVYQVYGGALADQMTRALPDAPTTAETTSASVDNLLLVAEGESDVGFIRVDTAIDAVRGSAGFEGPFPSRALATLYSNVTQVVVPAIRTSGASRISRAPPCPSARPTPALK
jgi:TRAP transporter TAXI family solute receptor